MAYRGGKIIKPILSGASQLSKMIAQGSNDISAINLQIAKERSQQFSDLIEAQGDIAVTGIENDDNLIRETAKKQISMLQFYHQQNKKGLLTRGDVNAYKAKVESNLNALAAHSEITQKNMQEVAKRVQDDELLAESLQINKLFGGYPNSKAFISHKVNGQEVKSIPNFARRIETDINGKMTVVVTKEVQETDNEGQPVFNEDGTAKTTNMEFSKPLMQTLGLGNKYIAKFDLTKNVKNLQATIGAREGAIIDSTGQVVNSVDYVEGLKTPNFQSYSYTVAPEHFQDMVNVVENRLEGISDDDTISILTEYFGAKAVYSEDYFGPRTKDEVNESMFHNVSVGGVNQKIPRYYDKEFNVMQFEQDPLVFSSDASANNTFVTDEQKELAKSFLRQQYYKSFNVKVQTLKDSFNKGYKSDEETPQLTTSSFYSKRDTENGKMERTPKDWNYINSIVKGMTIWASRPNKINDYNKHLTNKNLNGYDDNAKIANTITDLDTLNEEHEYYVDDLGSIALDDMKSLNILKETDSAGFKILSVDSIVTQQNPEDDDDQHMYLIVNSEALSSEEDRSTVDKLKQVKGDDVDMAVSSVQNKARDIESIVKLNDSNALRLYKYYYANVNGFAEKMSEIGFDKNAKYEYSDEGSNPIDAWTTYQSVKRVKTN